MKTKLIETGLFIVFLGVSSVLACTCPENFDLSLRQRTENAILGATAVFAGKVVGFEFKKDPKTEQSESDNKSQDEWSRRYAKFEVTQWWKLPLTNSILLRTDQFKSSNGMETLDSCDFTFKAGESYVVLAYQGELGLFTNACTRTVRANDAYLTLDILGKGNAPQKSKE